jgi:hypothetical protein
MSSMPGMVVLTSDSLDSMDRLLLLATSPPQWIDVRLGPG